MHHRIPDSEFRIYENVGHLPMEEIPEKSATDVHDFLQRRLNTPTSSR